MRLNYTMLHDDGQHLEASRRPTSCWSCVRGAKTPTRSISPIGRETGNVPLVPGVGYPAMSSSCRVRWWSAYASPERIVQIRQNRLLGLRAHHD